MYLGCLFCLFVYVELFRTNLKRSGLRIFPCTINCQTQVLRAHTLRMRIWRHLPLLVSWIQAVSRQRHCCRRRLSKSLRIRVPKVRHNNASELTAHTIGFLIVLDVCRCGPQLKAGDSAEAVQREAQLAAEQAAHGVTVLGRANHAQTGLYTQAFFGLSIGVERMGKLIFLADHAIRSNGAFPTDQDLRKIGHDLASLLTKCEAISAGLSQPRDYMARPSDAIHRGIEDVLSLFSTKLRYYNLNHLAGTAQGQQDPVTLWWEKVATPICGRHYSQQQREKDEADAVTIESIMGDNSFILHSTEAGEPIRDIRTFFARSQVTRVLQKYGRLYTLQIVRWLASIIFDLSHRGAYEQRIQALLGLHEPFTIFMNEDKYLRDRRAWSIYPR
jgi:hypothetical protein